MKNDDMIRQSENGFIFRYSNTRVTNSEKEVARKILGESFTLGALTLDEYTDRVEKIIDAKTYSDLWNLTKDLPNHSVKYLAPKESKIPSYFKIVPSRGEKIAIAASWILMIVVLVVCVTAMAASS